MIKENFVNLVKACKNDDDMLKIVESDMKAAVEYVHTVCMMETSIPVLRARFDGQELRDRITKLDENRRFAHERAIMGVKRLNRFAEMEGLEAIFNGDINDRYQVADFCQNAVNELFDGRTGKEFSLEQIINDLNEEPEYDDDELSLD